MSLFIYPSSSTHSPHPFFHPIPASSSSSSSSSPYCVMAQQSAFVQAFVPPVAHASRASSQKTKSSAPRRPPEPSFNIATKVQTLIHGSPRQGFGAAEDLEVFLHQATYRRAQSWNTKANTRANSLFTMRGGAGTGKQRRNIHPVTRVAECYVLPQATDVVILHPGF